MNKEKIILTDVLRKLKPRQAVFLKIDTFEIVNPFDYIKEYFSDNYAMLDDVKTQEREYRPFYEIKELYPRYLFVSDLILQKNIDGIKNVNIVDFIYNNQDLY